MKRYSPEDWRNISRLFNILNSKPTRHSSDSFYNGFPRSQEELDQRYKKAKKFWGKVFLVIFAIVALLYYMRSLPPSDTEMKMSRFQSNNTVHNVGTLHEVRQVKDYILEKLPNPKSYYCTTTDWGHVEKDMNRFLFTVTHHYYADDSLGNYKYYTEYFELDSLGNVVFSQIKDIEDAERPKWQQAL